MTLERELMMKSEKLLSKFKNNETLTVQEYRRLMFCCRLNNRMVNILTNKLEKKGIIRMKNGHGRQTLIVVNK